MGIRRQFADPFIVDVHAGGDLVIGGGVALLRFDGFAVDADLVDLQVASGEDQFAVGQTQGCESQAFSRFGKLQADGVVAGLGDLHVGGGHAFGSLAAPVLLGPGTVSIHDISGGGVKHKVHFHLLHSGESFLVHNDPGGAVQAAVPGTGIGGQLAHPLVIQVHTGDDAVIGRSVALCESNGLIVYANFPDFDGIAGEKKFALAYTDSRKGQAGGFFRELQADGIFTGPGDVRINGGYAFRSTVSPVLESPAGIGIHQVADGTEAGFFGSFGSGKAYAAERQRQCQDQRNDGGQVLFHGRSSLKICTIGFFYIFRFSAGSSATVSPGSRIPSAMIWRG